MWSVNCRFSLTWPIILWINCIGQLKYVVYVSKIRIMHILGNSYMTGQHNMHGVTCIDLSVSGLCPLSLTACDNLKKDPIKQKAKVKVYAMDVKII